MTATRLPPGAPAPCRHGASIALKKKSMNSFRPIKTAKALMPVFAILLCFGRAAVAEGTRPNVLFIISDDQERREFNFLPEGRDEAGKPRNLSPNLDRLAREGVVLLNQYVTSPVCTPSRFSVLTGTYASRSSNFERTVKNNGQVNITWNCHIDPETPNLARTLQQAGYFTGAVGKNHVIEVKGVGRGGQPMTRIRMIRSSPPTTPGSSRNWSRRSRLAASTSLRTCIRATFLDTPARPSNFTIWIG